MLPQINSKISYLENDFTMGYNTIKFLYLKKPYHAKLKQKYRPYGSNYSHFQN